MSDIVPLFGVALGVLVAVLYPVIKGYVQKEFVATAAPEFFPPWAKKYLALGIFCLLTGLIILAGYRAVNPDTQVSFWMALVMGFGWESSVEKLFAKPLGTGLDARIPEQPSQRPGPEI